MARIVALSSMVARGHVGLSAIVPALQLLGHDVIALPTVVLSNHPGHARAAGTTVTPETLAAMLDALEANRWLVEVDGVLSGYLPSPAHVRFAVSLVERVRRHRPDARFVCDPVLGDDPKGLYVDAGTALTVRDALIAHANIITPNRFELGWLSGRPVHDSSSAIEAARALRATTTLATSIPSADKTVANILVTPRGAVQCVVEQRAAVPHGTGDFMAALFTGFCLSGGREEDHLARAAAAVACVVEASLGRDELELVAARETWLRAQPLPVDVL